MPSPGGFDVGAIPLLSTVRGNPSVSPLRPGSLYTTRWLGNFGTEITGFRVDLCASDVQKAWEIIPRRCVVVRSCRLGSGYFSLAFSRMRSLSAAGAQAPVWDWQGWCSAF